MQNKTEQSFHVPAHYHSHCFQIVKLSSRRKMEITVKFILALSTFLLQISMLHVCFFSIPLVIVYVHVLP